MGVIIGFSSRSCQAALVDQVIVRYESIPGNFTQSGSGFAAGCQGLALAISRLTRDCCQGFGYMGQAAADHYWLFGGTLLAAGILYWHILPKVKVHVEYKSTPKKTIEIS